MSIINKIISKIKGEEYTLSPDIPVGYLIRLMTRRFFMLIRGKLTFIESNGVFFVGKHVTLKAKSKIKVGRGVTIDDRSFIDALSIDGVIFGDKVSLGKGTVIECSGSLKFLGKGIKVSDNVGLGRDCFYGCAGGIEIGKDTIIGNFVSFHSENHNCAILDFPIRLQGVSHKGIIIGEDCWIGAKATILDGVILGDGSIIAAGAVLKSGIYEGNSIYGGIPAKKIKNR